MHANRHRRVKLSHDPNNTTWSRSANGYGQKLLLSQGWSPGDLLGVKDAPHASLHSQASASHIKVTLKDNNLGLGAKHGASEGQCTGLDIFQDVLGRLNGKAQTVIEAEQESRAVLRRATYAENRWGSLRFVSGGLLVRDEIQKPVKETSQPLPAIKVTSLLTTHVTPPRELEEIAKPEDQDRTGNSPSSKEVKTPNKVVHRKITGSAHGTLETSPQRALSIGKDCESVFEVEPKDTTHSKDELRQPSSDKAQRRAEKEQRKLQRKLRREAKKASRMDSSMEQSAMTATSILQEQSSPLIIALPPMETDKIPDTIPRKIVASGRHIVRQRYIRHKKMAVMDKRALNEVGYFQPFLKWKPRAVCKLMH